MLRKKFTLAVIAVIICFGIYSEAKAQKQKKEPKVHKPTAVSYLSGGQIGNGDSVSVSQFKSLLSQKLIVKDSLGRTFPVQSFNFIYINRGVYADSTGRPVILSDYLYSNSTNGLLPDFWKKGLLPQIKPGDTAIFSNIRYYPITTDTKAQIDSSIVAIVADTIITKKPTPDRLKQTTDTTKKPNIEAPLLYGKTIRISIY